MKRNKKFINPINPYTGNVSVLAIWRNLENGHFKFPDGMGNTIGRRAGKLTAAQAKDRGLPVAPKANRAKINKLFDGVKPYE